MADKKKTREERNKEKEDRLEAVRELLFGKWDGEYMGNIWGWKVSIIGFFFLSALTILVIYGHRNGYIDAFNPVDNSPRKEITTDSLNQE